MQRSGGARQHALMMGSPAGEVRTPTGRAVRGDRVLPAWASAGTRLRRALLLSVTALVGLPAVSAHAADWIPEEGFGTVAATPRSFLAEGIVAGDGTALTVAANRDTDELVVTRRTPGGPARSTSIPSIEDWDLAASAAGTVAVLVTTASGSGYERRVWSWRPGDETATRTAPWTLPTYRPGVLALFDEQRVGVVEGTSFARADETRQLVGELGGALTSESLKLADGQGLMRAFSLETATRAGRSPVVFVGTSDGRLLLSRAAGGAFAPASLLETYATPGADGPTDVNTLRPSMAADGSLTVAFETEASAQPAGAGTQRTSFSAIRGARVSAAGKLADDRVFTSVTSVTPHGFASQDFDKLAGNATGPSGSQTVAWNATRLSRTSDSRTRVLAARRAAGVAEPTAAQQLGRE
ncbi:MAG: hypothetical protein M3417_05990, partial [Actinomycetota bacterium]|nr:hypothetical protein [Actinomycetota bacterium]